METNPNPDLELVQAAIQRLLQDKKETTEEEEKRKRQLQPSSDDDDDDHLLLSKLLSQVESLKASRAIEKPEASADTGVAADEVKAKSDAAIEAVKLEAQEENEGGEMEASPEEIMRELKKVKRQNTVTHWLLSAMIALTVAWQFSEVSLILKVRDGLSHPFRSFGSAITDFFKGPAMKGRDDADKDADQRQSETMGIPPLKMPELPHLDVPDLIPNGGNHSPGSA
ncbi:uncharacterized protein LOC115672041 [Syzygium oleosum]|uniref:uncharacterized protein LOC115672041 n=1 Tax=Syzygium oleosum TaxID=219896 RepID=UPI0024B9DD8B|nr:uncharacterized protein LOC115672041 [Syzygium oleosum]